MTPPPHSRFMDDFWVKFLTLYTDKYGNCRREVLIKSTYFRPTSAHITLKQNQLKQHILLYCEFTVYFPLMMEAFEELVFLVWTEEECCGIV